MPRPIPAIRSIAPAALAVLFVCSFIPHARADRNTPPPQRSASSALAPRENDAKLPRVLLIGDSISIGYTAPTRELLRGEADVQRIPTNGGPTIKGLAELDQWLGQAHWDVIHFNWGLHDLKRIEGKHQVPIDQYEKNLRRLVARLKKTGAKLIWCSTTPVPEGASPPRSNADAVRYNAVARKIMEEGGIAINDLYSFALPQLGKIQRPQNVHFSPEGSKALAAEVARHIRAALQTEKSLQEKK